MRAFVSQYLRLGLLTLMAVVAMAMTSSCDDYDYERARESYNSQQESFISAFAEMFAPISSTHSWTSLAEGSVSFPAQGDDDATLRFYTSDPRYTTTPAYLLAEYAYESGKVYDYQYPVGLKYLYATLQSRSDVIVYRFPTGLSQIPDQDNTLSVGTMLPDHPAMRYMLAFETSASSGVSKSLDFDYNDCVLGIDYVQGQSKASLQVLCAGTTAGVKVTYMRGDVLSDPRDETLVQEVHAALGLSGYYDSWDKTYRYDIIGTGEGENALMPLSQPSVTFSLNSSDRYPSHVLARVCCLFGAEDAKDSDKERLRLQISAGFRLGQVLAIPDGSWTWPTEGNIFSFNYDAFCNWLTDCQGHPFWYSNLWHSTNRIETLSTGDIQYGCRLTLDSIDSNTCLVSAEQLEVYAGYDATLTFVVSSMTYGATLKLCKYSHLSDYYEAQISVSRAGTYTIDLTPLDIRNLCGLTIQSQGGTGLEIRMSRCALTAVYIR